MGSFFIKINVKIKRLPLTLAPKDPLGPEISRNRSNFLCGFCHLAAIRAKRFPFAVGIARQIEWRENLYSKN